MQAPIWPAGPVCDGPPTLTPMANTAILRARLHGLQVLLQDGIDVAPEARRAHHLLQVQGHVVADAQRHHCPAVIQLPALHLLLSAHQTQLAMQVYLAALPASKYLAPRLDTVKDALQLPCASQYLVIWRSYAAQQMPNPMPHSTERHA